MPTKPKGISDDEQTKEPAPGMNADGTLNTVEKDAPPFEPTIVDQEQEREIDDTEADEDQQPEDFDDVDDDLDLDGEFEDTDVEDRS